MVGSWQMRHKTCLNSIMNFVADYGNGIAVLRN